MHLLKTFARAYPIQSAVMLCALLVAGLVEGLSLIALLPLLNHVLVKPDSPAGDVSGLEADSGIGGSLLSAIEATGLTPSVELLLIIILLGAFIKGGLTLLARQKVGYIVAHVATDLRLSMLRAMLASRWEYFLHQPVGRLTNSMSIEASRSANAYLHGATLISLVIEAAVYLTIATLVMWQAALIALLVGLLIYRLLGGLVKKARRAGKRHEQSGAHRPQITRASFSAASFSAARLPAALLVFVLLFEFVYLGVYQPSFEEAGIPMIDITTTNSSGEAKVRRLARFETDDKLYLSAHHWPRGWYGQALSNREVRAEIDGVTSDYVAVAVAGEEFERVSAEHPLGFVVMFLMGFPPERDILRLDPRD